MKEQLHLSVFLILILLLALSGQISGTERWEAPFFTDTLIGGDDSVLTLQTVLSLVATQNPILSSLVAMKKVVQSNIIQAGVKPNPELEAEIGGVSWDFPGFDESEIVVSFSQEFELFGQGGARKKVAEAEWQATEYKAKVIAFDLYLETVKRYNILVHAQEQYHLSNISIGLMKDIVITIQDRIDKGATLESELLLAELELQRTELARADISVDLKTARISLTSLWGGDYSGIRVIAPVEPDIERLFSQIPESMDDSTRDFLALDYQRNQLNAERHLAAIETKPNLTLSGGYKHLAADKSNSLLFGVSLTLPFRNQNCGTMQSLNSEIQQVDFERQQVRLESSAAFATSVARLRQLKHHHIMLDNELLPTAEKVYQMIQNLYQSVRLPYTNLLEVNRALVELKFERNDIILSLREQIIELEKLVGIILQPNKDLDNDK